MSPSPETTTTTKEAAKPGGSKKKLILIILLVLVLGGGGVGYYLYHAKAVAAAAKAKADKDKKSTDEEESKDGEESESESETDKESGKEGGKESKDKGKSSLNVKELGLPNDKNVIKVVALDPFILNLADKEDNRYLRLTVHLGIGSGEGEEEKPSVLFTSQARNAILSVLMLKASTDILTVEGRNELRKELLTVIRKAVKEPKVEAIYITEFIIQR